MSFDGDINIFVAKVTDRLEGLPADAANNVVYDVRTPTDAGGNMPVVTGNLRNDIVLSYSGPSPADRPLVDRNRPAKDPSQKIFDQLLKFKLGRTLWISFRAIYAPVMELKYAFVRLTSQKWQRLVDESVADMKKRFP